MKMYRLLSSLFLLLSLPVLLCAEVYEEPFEAVGPDGVVPFGWRATDPANINIQKIAGRQYLRIWRTTGKGPDGGGSGAAYLVGTEADIVNGQIGDLQAEVTIRLGGAGEPITSLRGVVLRAQTPELVAPKQAGFWGYSVGFISKGEGRGLAIYENPTGTSSTGLGVSRAFAALPHDLQGDTDYLFKVSAQGKTLKASLFAADGTTLLATVHYDEAETAGGYFGLRAAHSNSGVNTYFRTLKLEAVPPAKP